jgi:hypothetical protein
MRIACIFVVLLGACGSGPAPGTTPSSPAKATSPPTAAAPPPAAATAAAVDCDDACTGYGICYEEYYKKDFRGGGGCVSSCEQKSPADQRAWADKVAAATGDDKCASLFSD